MSNEADKTQPVCPDCKSGIERIVTHEGVIWRCQKCDGTLFGSDALIHLASKELVANIWAGVGKTNSDSKIQCPLCEKRMLKSSVQLQEQRFELGVCNGCVKAWFSASELRKAIDLFNTHPEAVASTELSDFDPLLREPPTDETWGKILKFLGMLIEASTWL